MRWRSQKKRLKAAVRVVVYAAPVCDGQGKKSHMSKERSKEGNEVTGGGG